MKHLTAADALDEACSVAAAKIALLRSKIAPSNALLVGISGIDAGGKGFVTAKLASVLKHNGFKTAVINVDGWLNLPNVRFGGQNAGKHFYKHALRLDEMFERLILPLKQCGSVDIESDLTEETAAEFRRHRYSIDHADVVLLEGIFIFKRQYRKLFDLKIWVDCSFETAIKRAALRSQESLSVDDTVKAYRSIYFPAQITHFKRDQPRESADLTIVNDDRLQ
jgi:uridine kinase